MHRRALNCCFRAAPAQAFVTAFSVFVLSVLAFAISATETHAEAALAFGYDSNGQWVFGSSWNYQTKEGARSAAQARCTQQGARCDVVLETDRCIAVATDSSMSSAGWSGNRAIRNISMAPAR
jgi:hypothetical protein